MKKNVYRKFLFWGMAIAVVIAAVIAGCTPIEGDIDEVREKAGGGGHTVTFNSMGGSAVPRQRVKGGELATQPPDPNRTGFAFADWYSEEACTNKYSFSTPVTESIVLYARWANTNTHIVNFNSTGGGAVGPQNVVHGESATKPADPIWNGYTFNGWYNEALTIAYDFSNLVTGSMTLYAKWTVHTLNISYANGGGTGSAPASPFSAVYGTNVTMPANTYSRTGYSFTGWAVSGSGSIAGVHGAGASVAVSALSTAITTGNASITLTATWKSTNKFVAIAGTNSAAVSYSTDGINWTGAALPSSADWSSVCFGSGLYVAVAKDSNKAAYSADGVNWTAASLPSSAKWSSVCYGNGRFVAVTDGPDSSTNSTVAAYSTNGTTWTQAALPAGQWRSVCYGTGQFVTCGYKTGGIFVMDRFATSPDGITWTARTFNAYGNWKTICYGNTRYVALDNSSTLIAYSTDGINWTQYTMPTLAWSSVCYGNGIFVAVADHDSLSDSSRAAYSGNGSTWTAATLSSAAKWSSVCYGNGRFVAVATNNSNKATYSTTGTGGWTAATLSSSANWSSVCFGTF